jgi:hypothetical protein
VDRLLEAGRTEAIKYFRGKEDVTVLAKMLTLRGRWFVLEVHEKRIIFLNRISIKKSEIENRKCPKKIIFTNDLLMKQIA